MTSISCEAAALIIAWLNRFRTWIVDATPNPEGTMLIIEFEEPEHELEGKDLAEFAATLLHLPVEEATVLEDGKLRLTWRPT